MKMLNGFYLDEKGGGLIEYGLIIALIALSAVAAITATGVKLTDTLASLANTLENLQTNRGP